MTAPIQGDPQHPTLGQSQPCFKEPSAYIATAEFSPNGKWIAYGSPEAGEIELFVRAFPDNGGKWQVSTDGAWLPAWSRDGNSLFYVNASDRLMTVDVNTSSNSFQFGVPRPWTGLQEQQSLGFIPGFWPGPKPNQMVIIRDTINGTQAPAQVTVGLNFFDEVRRRLRSFDAK
jgi:serine/threonine-protein kinase